MTQTILATETGRDPFGGSPENWSLPVDGKPAAELTDADLDVIYGDPTYVEWCARLDAMADAAGY